ncbi:MAG: T9SS type A sorting domain-containing protein [Paludibacteraceae bacterium]|nr:T9SS type A sorting domain-containing protein [Paludibacteraceae bacterium]
MKQLFAISVALLLLIGQAGACIKKSKAESGTTDLTVIVMDSTQALIADAQVKIGKTVFTTSFDGRVVLKPGQWSVGEQLTVSHADFKSVTFKMKDHTTPQIVFLTPKPGKTSGGEKGRIYGAGSARGAKGEVMYKTMTTGVARPVMADAAVMEMEMEEMAVAEDAHILPYRPGPAVENNVSAGKLTAGEVNDFTKWNLWSHVVDSTHKRFIPDWRLLAKERYTVQVVDKHGYPIVNYPVNLTDTRGNTVYQAVTDNTGKAELWNGLTGERADVNQPSFQTLVVDESCEHSDDVDVMFVFDATGSMGDELRYLQAEMKDVIARAKDATGGLNIRTGAVVYRDHGDEYLTRISRLTTDIKTTQSFIDKQEANGGGDYPEAVPEALMAALNSAGWNPEARARIAFLILDAPCHQDSATLVLLHDQVLNAAALGVRVVPVVCSGLGESGELLLRSIALATNGTSFFLTDDSGIGNPHLKPTTDSLKVEHLNDMLVRTIVEFSYMPDCKGHWHEEEIENVEEQFIPNPFSPRDIELDPSIPHGPTTLYLLDVSGKLISIYQGVLEEAGDSQLSSLPVSLSTGIYFVKAFYDGQWHTKKILVH